MEIIIALIVIFACIVALSISNEKKKPEQPAPIVVDVSIEKSETMIPKYFVFDVETTGLAYSTKPSETYAMPRVVSVGWYVLDEDFKEVKSEYFILKPYRYQIPKDSVMIHGITRERAVMEGLPHNEVYPKLLEDLHQCELVVCHNASFDVPVLEADFIRWNFGRSIIGVKLVACTMKSGTELCAIPKTRGRGYKYPKLSELYLRMYYNKYPNARFGGKLHNAKFDALVTCLCLKGFDVRSIPLKIEKLKY